VTTSGISAVVDGSTSIAWTMPASPEPVVVSFSRLPIGCLSQALTSLVNVARQFGNAFRHAASAVQRAAAWSSAACASTAKRLKKGTSIAVAPSRVTVRTLDGCHFK
jgi:hypothetical protein